VQIETAEDRLLTFFGTEDFAVECLIQGPGGPQTIPVILNAISDPVTLYDTNVEAPNAHFIARVEDLAVVDRRQLRSYTATIEGLSYGLERLTDDMDGKIVTVYLKK
jgi:hypothetical protein